MRLKDSTKVNPQELYQYLTQEKGLSHNHAVGMIANIRAESNFNSSAIGDGGNSGGLFQHNTNRFEALKEFSGGDWKDWRKQVDYALTESDTKKYLQQDFVTPEDASYWFTTKWERPSNKEQKAKERQRFAKEYDYEFINPQIQDPQEEFQQELIPFHLQETDKTYVEPITPAKLNKAIEEVQYIEQDLQESPELRAIENKKKFIQQIDPFFPIDTFDFNEPQPQQQSQPTPFNIELKPLIDKLPILPNLFQTQLNPQFEDGGTFEQDPPPIYVTNPNDPRLKAYQDSLKLYNKSITDLKTRGSDKRENTFFPNDPLIAPLSYMWEGPIQPLFVEQYTGGYEGRGTAFIPVYKKPNQLVVLKPKTDSEKPIPSDSDAYKKKHPDIYVTDPNDPSIGTYTEDGNLIVYKKPSAPNLDTDLAAWLKTQGTPTSFTERKRLYEQATGKTDYKGTAEQNIGLLNMLKEKGLEHKAETLAEQSQETQQPAVQQQTPLLQVEPLSPTTPQEKPIETPKQNVIPQVAPAGYNLWTHNGQPLDPQIYGYAPSTEGPRQISQFADTHALKRTTELYNKIGATPWATEGKRILITNDRPINFGRKVDAEKQLEAIAKERGLDPQQLEIIKLPAGWTGYTVVERINERTLFDATPPRIQ